jgi:hypothetical protein
MDNNYNRRTDYSNAVDTELQRLIEEMMRNFIRPSNNESERTNEDYIIFLRTLRDIMSVYNSNMIEYHNNTTLSLQLLQNYLTQVSSNSRESSNYYNTATSNRRETVEIPRQQHLPQQRRNSINSINSRSNTNISDISNNREHLLSYVVYRPTIRSQDANALRNFFQNIIVYPTREQIQDATQLITYNSNVENISSSCPITLDEFQDGDIIRQIKHCRHVFHEQSIQNWFRSNVRCPVCRYDIREYRNPEIVEENVNDIEEQDEAEINETQINDREQYSNYESIFQELSNNISQDIQNILTENLGENGVLDSSQNYLFEFEIR